MFGNMKNVNFFIPQDTFGCCLYVIEEFSPSSEGKLSVGKCARYEIQKAVKDRQLIELAGPTID